MYLATFTFTVAVLPVLLLCYYLIPAKGKTGFLLVCSLFIYGWGAPIRVLYPLAGICFDYGMGILLEKLQGKKVRSALLLFFTVLAHVAGMVGIRAAAASGAILLPFGIAIYTLHGISYLIGVYRGRHKANINFVNLALYLSLFPLLYAGPVISYLEFDEQLRRRQCNIIHLSDGLTLFIQGLAEKVVLADMFGYIFRELHQLGELSMLTAWLMGISFTMYLYFELLGYTEMARGLGRAFGFDFPKNFNHPFFTSSVTAFMQSWNITLLLWFQTNFRYFIFGTKPRNKREKYTVIIITWMLIGVWYGIRMQFLLWGLAVGLLLTFDQLVLEPLTQKRYVFGMLCTALLLQFAWVLFFASDLLEACRIWKAMLGFGNGIADQHGLYFFTSYIAMILLGMYIATDLFRNISERIGNTAVGRFFHRWRPLAHGALFVYCLASMLYGERVEGLWLQL